MPSAFHPAAQVVPWIGLGVALQGMYLLTSIGLNITKHTEYYPMATGIAAATSVGANLLLVPTFGIIGAAWANALAYGVLAFVSWRFASRFFPIDYETGRLVRVVGAALLSVSAAVWAVPALPPVAGFFARGATVVIVYVAVLVGTRFFIPHEIAQMSVLVTRVRRRKVIEEPVDASELAGELVSAPTSDVAIEMDGTEPEREASV